MEKVNITIGSVTFDRADYDADNDVLYLSIGEPNGGECEETPEMHVVCYAPGTYEIRALTIFNTRARIERDGHLAVTLPETSKMSAEDLAAALAAVETPAEASRGR
jgi:uncharacterized protein YuzE